MENIYELFSFIKFSILIFTLLFTIKIKKPIKIEPEITKVINDNINNNVNKDIESIKDIDNFNIINDIETPPTEDPNAIENKKKQDLNDLKRYNELIDMPKNPKDPLIERERKIILNAYYYTENKTDIIIYFDMRFPFGNQIAAFNKMIFYCEIIRCKKIMIMKDNKMYINHTLYDKDYNITIEISDFNYFLVDNDYITNLSPNFFFDFYNFKVENRLDIIKHEIVNNLPKIKLDKKDLIIHFRSSDIFQHKDDPVHAPDYAQPPLCFYERILNKFNFSNIYIISVDDIYNPVIKILRTKYPKIIYNENSLEIDISYLVRGFNIVGSISSFLISSIKLNDNLKFLWEYDRYPMCSKMYHSHHSIFNIKRNYTTYLMEPSEIYKDKMIVWKGSDDQIKIMLNDTCPYDFKIVAPNI